MKWINVDDELPVLEQLVLVAYTSYDGVRDVLPGMMARRKFKLEWGYEENGFEYWTEIENVTHWMPLPKPP